MMLNVSRFLSSAVFSLAFLAFAPVANSAVVTSSDFSRCLQHFANGKPPELRLKKEMKPRALCFDGFAVMHSGESHTPIYVAERLNKALVEKNIDRGDRFYEEARLPRSERSRLEDYKNSGYDRGHMAPAADMGTDSAMAQSFSLSNMVPQAPNNNRKAWAKIEKDTRKYVMRAKGDVFVITGPVYENKPVTIGASEVWVPQYLYKLVYDPSSGRAWAHWIENSNKARAGKPISYQELVQRTGIDFVPNLN